MATLTEAQVLALTDTELADLFPLVQAEWTRREEAAMAEDRINDAVLSVHTAEPGAAWVQPTGVTTSYPRGARVTHATKDWISTAAANMGEPGVSQWWVEVTGTHPAWLNSIPYVVGDIVTHADLLWVAIRNHQGREPGTQAAVRFWAQSEGVA